MSDSTPASALDVGTVERLRTVSTATLTMVLIKQGVRTSWLRGPVPLDPIEKPIVGPAFTIRFVPGREDLSDPESYARSPSFRDAIEAASAGSVVVIDGYGKPHGATLGDILVARLARKGVAAAVTDALVRDADEIRAVGLPVLSAGVAVPPSIIGLACAGFGEIIGGGGGGSGAGTLREVRAAPGQGGGKRPRALSSRRRCPGGLSEMARFRRARRRIEIRAEGSGIRRSRSMRRAFEEPTFIVDQHHPGRTLGTPFPHHEIHIVDARGH